MIIRSEKDRQDLIVRIMRINLDKQPWDVKAKPYKPTRSNAQSNLLHMWCNEIGRQSGQTPMQVKNFIKFTYACPILAAIDEEFSDVYDGLIERYNYEECIHMMEFMPVTSRKMMTVGLMTEVLRHVELYAVEGGYTITKPVDKYHLAMGEQYASQQEQTNV